MRRPEKFIPLGVSFWRDDRVCAVGRPAAILLQQVMLAAREAGTDGTVTLPQVRQLPEYTAGRWRALTTPHPSVPQKGALVEELPLAKGTFVVPSWAKWNPTEDVRAADRHRKTKDAP